MLSVELEYTHIVINILLMVKMIILVRLCRFRDSGNSYLVNFLMEHFKYLEDFSVTDLSNFQYG